MIKHFALNRTYRGGLNAQRNIQKAGNDLALKPLKGSRAETDYRNLLLRQGSLYKKMKTILFLRSAGTALKGPSREGIARKKICISGMEKTR